MKARELILDADRIASEKGLTQSQWSRQSGHASNGQTVSRIISKGDCRLSTFVELLNVLECVLVIKARDEKDAELIETLLKQEDGADGEMD